MRVYALAWLLLAGFVACEKTRTYRGHRILSSTATTKSEVDILQSLADTYDLTVLREPSLKRSADFLVPQEKLQAVENTLTEAGLTYTVEDVDMQDQIDAEKKVFLEKSYSRSSNVLDHLSFYPLEQVNDYLKNFESEYPDLAVMKQMDRETHESRPIYFMEIGSPVGNKNKPVIFIEGLTHPREWAAGATLLYTMDMLLKGYKSGLGQIVDALDKYTWVIVPIVNVDGYVYTWTEDRMWRKNRRRINSTCTGVDLNRNYDVKWGTTGVKMDCKSNIYPGHAAFTEPETQNIRDLFRSLKPRVISFLSVHAYSQLLLHPWGYAESDTVTEFPDNLDELDRVGQLMANQLPNYSFGTAFDVLGYGASGASEDWALQDKPGIYAYCFEMRPNSFFKGHFMLPPSQIRPTGQEFLRSVLAMAQHMKQ